MNSMSLSPLGFGPFVRKEAAEWWQRRAILAIFAGVTLLGMLGTVAARIDEWVAGRTPTAAELDPTANILGALFDWWILFAAIFATIGLLIGERATGTLAWTLSKPISRTVVLGTKWLVAVVMLTTFGLVLPLAVSVGVATWAYGSLPDLGQVAILGLVLTAVPAFIVALNLALATRINSQAALGAIGVAVVAFPHLFGGFLPPVAELWPTSMSALAVAMASGESLNPPTLISWLIVVAGLAAVALFFFQREDM